MNDEKMKQLEGHIEGPWILDIHVGWPAHPALSHTAYLTFLDADEDDYVWDDATGEYELPTLTMDTDWDLVNGKKAKATLKLMAAAPELLAEVKRLRHTIGCFAHDEMQFIGGNLCDRHGTVVEDCSDYITDEHREN